MDFCKLNSLFMLRLCNKNNLMNSIFVIIFTNMLFFKKTICQNNNNNTLMIYHKIKKITKHTICFEFWHRYCYIDKCKRR